MSASSRSPRPAVHESTAPDTSTISGAPRRRRRLAESSTSPTFSRWTARTLAFLALPALLVAACDEDGPLQPDEHATFATDAEASAAERPGTVTDLEVISAAGGTVVLAFTAVSDGHGGGASYDVRFTGGPMKWGWGRAPSVENGTCATPLRGGAPGSRVECTVEGLEVGESYDFRLVAYRGTLDVDATFGRLSNIATATVEAAPAPSGDPGTVDDLRVAATGAESVTLRLTEVSDGAGGPASYEVRYAESPIGWGWGSATSAQDGTCVSPLRGDGVGTTLECTVEGLPAGDTLDFQVVAYRGTLDVDATFGGLSNVATGIPESPNQAPLADASASCDGLQCTFDATGSSDPDGSIVSYEWRFGDGTGGSGASVRHDYTESGSYTASVTVVDDEGATAGAQVTVDVQNPTVPAEDPGAVSDLRVASIGATTAVLTFTEVDDGAGGTASYDVRFTEGPIGWGWGSATSVEAGSCATPLRGNAAGSVLECTVEGLTPGTRYDFQLVAYRGTLDLDATFGELSNVATGTTESSGSDGSDSPDGDGSSDGGVSATECANPGAGWIWCDDFEEDRLSRYFEHVDDGGSFVRASSVGVDGSTGMRARFRAGQVSAGSLKLAFGRTPQSYFRPADDGSRDYREIYWRVYVRNQPGWKGGGGKKLSRATSFASSSSWAQAMIAHVWSGNGPDNLDHLVVDPASGTDSAGRLVTTTYNDFANLRWLGSSSGETPLFADDRVGRWYCVEARARLNDPGSANGEFQLWIDGKLDAERRDMNWVGSFDDYGINAVFLENYWNEGSPQAQERYFDNFVVSTRPIGCGGS